MWLYRNIFSLQYNKGYASLAGGALHGVNHLLLLAIIHPAIRENQVALSEGQGSAPAQTGMAGLSQALKYSSGNLQAGCQECIWVEGRGVGHTVGSIVPRASLCPAESPQGWGTFPLSILPDYCFLAHLPLRSKTIQKKNVHRLNTCCKSNYFVIHGCCPSAASYAHFPPC